MAAVRVLLAVIGIPLAVTVYLLVVIREIGANPKIEFGSKMYPQNR